MSDVEDLSVEQRTERSLARGIALLAVAQLTPSVPHMVDMLTASTVVGWVVGGSYLAWSVGCVVLFVGVLRVRLPGRELTAATAAAMTVCVTAVGIALPLAAVTSWQNWTPGPATGVAVLATVVGGGRWGAVTVAAVGGTYAATAWLRDPFAALPFVGTLGGQLLQLVAFTVITWFFCRLLRRAAQAADVAAAKAREAYAQQERLDVQRRTKDLLHVGPLAALDAVALAPSMIPALQDWCRREAADLRTGIGANGSRFDLRQALTVAVRKGRDRGLDIVDLYDTLPENVPKDVVERLQQAVLERPTRGEPLVDVLDEPGRGVNVDLVAHRHHARHALVGDLGGQRPIGADPLVHPGRRIGGGGGLGVGGAAGVEH